MFRNFFRNINRRRILKDIYKLQQNRSKSFKYIHKNTKIGIIINITSKKIDQNTNQFIELLKKDNDVNYIKFVNFRPKKKEILPERTFTIYGRKYLQSERLNDFLNHKYDILIIISTEELLKLHHVIALTKADLKVSAHFDELNFADLTFITKNKDDCIEYFNAIKQYLLKKQ